MNRFRHSFLVRLLAVVTMQVFCFEQMAWAAPSSRSVFSTKSTNYESIRQRNLQQLEQKRRLHDGGSLDIEAPAADPAATTLMSLMRPASSGLHVPSVDGQIMEVWSPSGDVRTSLPAIIILQDLHAQPDAQRAESRILEHLASTYGITRIAVEGAWGELDLSFPREFPKSHRLRDLVAETSLEFGELSAEEYVAIRSLKPLTIYGVEESSLYDTDRRLYLEVQQETSDGSEKLSAVGRAIETLKPKVYGEALRHFDEQCRKFSQGTATLEEHVGWLSEQAETVGVDVSSVGPNVQRFVRLHALRNTVDTGVVSEQLYRLLKDLEVHLPNRSAEKSQLRTLTQQLNAGEVSPEECYGRAMSLARETGFLLTSYTALTDLDEYLRIAGTLELSKILEDIENVEAAVEQRMAETEDAKELARASRRLKLFEGLLTLGLTSGQFADVQTYARDVRIGWFEEALNPLLARHGLVALPELSSKVPDTLIEKARRFYEVALDRDRIMAERTLAWAGQESTAPTVLIVGGFHTEGITKRFREARISYAVVSPSADGVTDDAHYRRLLAGERVGPEEFASRAISIRKTLAAGPRGRSTLRVQSALVNAGFREDWAARVAATAARLHADEPGVLSQLMQELRNAGLDIVKDASGRFLLVYDRPRHGVVALRIGEGFVETVDDQQSVLTAREHAASTQGATVVDASLHRELVRQVADASYLAIGDGPVETAGDVYRPEFAEAVQSAVRQAFDNMEVFLKAGGADQRMLEVLRRLWLSSGVHFVDAEADRLGTVLDDATILIFRHAWDVQQGRFIRPFLIERELFLRLFPLFDEPSVEDALGMLAQFVGNPTNPSALPSIKRLVTSWSDMSVAEARRLAAVRGWLLDHATPHPPLGGVELHVVPSAQGVEIQKLTVPVNGVMVDFAMQSGALSVAQAGQQTPFNDVQAAYRALAIAVANATNLDKSRSGSEFVEIVVATEGIAGGEALAQFIMAADGAGAAGQRNSAVTREELLAHLSTQAGQAAFQQVLGSVFELIGRQTGFHTVVMSHRGRELTVSANTSALSETVQGIRSRIRTSRDSEIGQMLMADLVEQLNRLFPIPLPIEAFLDLRIVLNGDLENPLERLEAQTHLRRQGIVELRLGEAFRYLQHSEQPYDSFLLDRHVQAVLMGLQRLADMADSGRAAGVLEVMKGRGAMRQSTAEQAARIDALYRHYGTWYAEFTEDEKVVYWLAGLLHDLFKPFEYPQHDALVSRLVQSLPIQGLDDAHRQLLGAVMELHTLYGRSKMRETRSDYVARELAAIAERVNPAQRRSFFRLALLLVLGDQDGVGNNGKLDIDEIIFLEELGARAEAMVSEQTEPGHGAPTEADENFYLREGKERLLAFTLPNPGTEEAGLSSDERWNRLQPIVEEAIEDESERRQFLLDLGRVFTLSPVQSGLTRFADKSHAVMFLKQVTDALRALELNPVDITVRLHHRSIGFKQVLSTRVQKALSISADPSNWIEVSPDRARATVVSTQFGSMVFEVDPTGTEVIVTLANSRWYQLRDEAMSKHSQRTRFLTDVAGGRDKTYDRIAREHLPHGKVPALAQGLSAVLQNTQPAYGSETRSVVWADLGAGVGAALQQGIQLFPWIRGIWVDAVDWKTKHFSKEERQQFRREAELRGIPQKAIWERTGLRELQEDLGQVSYGGRGQVGADGVDIITSFSALYQREDPLGSLAHQYNQLRAGGYMFMTLHLPADHPDVELLVELYRRVFAHLDSHGVVAELKVNDLRSEGTPEIVLGMVLHKPDKAPASLALQLTPARIDQFSERTRRDTRYIVTTYAGDWQEPFVYSSEPVVSKRRLRGVHWNGDGGIGPRNLSGADEFLKTLAGVLGRTPREALMNEKALEPYQVLYRVIEGIRARGVMLPGTSSFHYEALYILLEGYFQRGESFLTCACDASAWVLRKISRVAPNLPPNQLEALIASIALVIDTGRRGELPLSDRRYRLQTSQYALELSTNIVLAMFGEKRTTMRSGVMSVEEIRAAVDSGEQVIVSVMTERGAHWVPAQVVDGTVQYQYQPEGQAAQTFELRDAGLLPVVTSKRTGFRRVSESFAQNTWAGARTEATAQRLTRKLSAGFVSTVQDRLGEHGVIETARRQEGERVTGGALDLNTGEIKLESATDNAQVARTSEWLTAGFAWLAEQRGTVPVIDKVLREAAAHNVTFIPIDFRKDHASTMDFTDHDGARAHVDVTVANELQGEQYAKGRQLAYAFSWLHNIAQHAGYDDRQSIHLLIALYERLSVEDRKAFHGVLQSPYVDHGREWDFFFTQVSNDEVFRASMTELQRGRTDIHLEDSGIHGVDSLELQERFRRDKDETAREGLGRVLDFRNLWVSWLIGRLDFDIPFDHRKFMEVYHDPNLDLDTKKVVLYQIIKSYDRDVERANAERVGRQAREDRQIVVGGRWSIAFRDQGLQIASARMLIVDNTLRKAVARLDNRLQKLVKELTKLKADGDVITRAKQVAHYTARLRALVNAESAVPEAMIQRFTKGESMMGEIAGVLEVFEVVGKRDIKTREAMAFSRFNEDSIGRQEKRFNRRPYRLEEEKLTEETKTIWNLLYKVDDAAAAAEKRPYSKMVALQRASDSGSINFAYGIGFEPSPGQPPALRRDWRRGGHHFWMSPDASAWLKQVDYLIEFIPLFIGERKYKVTRDDGRVLEYRETDVDQKGLEQAVRSMADAWGDNIDLTTDSEYVMLARQVVVEVSLGTETVEAFMRDNGVDRETAVLELLRRADPEQQASWAREIAAVAMWIDAQVMDSREASDRIDDYLGQEWEKGNEIERFEAVREVVLGGRAGFDGVLSAVRPWVKRAQGAQAYERYKDLLFDRRKEMPMWMMGTTEAPGLTEALVLHWLENEMALRNVIRAKGLESEVKQVMKDFDNRLTELGRVVLEEFGYGMKIKSVATSQNISEEAAIRQLVGENTTMKREVAKLAVLRAWAERSEKASGYVFSQATPDPAALQAFLEPTNASEREALDREARHTVFAQNRADLQKDVDTLTKQGLSFDDALAAAIRNKQVRGNPIYYEHWVSARKWHARQRLIQQLNLESQVGTWFRDHTALKQTTARQVVVERHRLRELMVDSRYNYRSDATYRISGKDGQPPMWKPNPRKMRYFMGAGPSQVDLGGEGDESGSQLKSIKAWPQWVQVVSTLGERKARKLFEAYHFQPEIRRAPQGENMKVMKNSRTAMERAVINLLGEVGYVDIEDVVVQTLLHGDRLQAYFFGAKTDKAGPTAGYCIPKDIKFLIWEAILTDRDVLLAMGVPENQVDQTLALTRQVWQEWVNGAFESEAEWEIWAAQEAAKANEEFRKLVGLEEGIFAQDEIGLAGGVGVVYDITRIAKVMQKVGRAIPGYGNLKDPYNGLARLLAAEQLGELESVNRRASFRWITDIYDGLDLAKQLNPDIKITDPQDLRIHAPTQYKGTGSPVLLADVRYSRAIQVAHVLTALRGVLDTEGDAGLESFTQEVEAEGWKLLQPLLASLRSDDEAFVMLGLLGFRPESTNPVDLAVTRFVAQWLLHVTPDVVELDREFRQELNKIDMSESDGLYRVELLTTRWIAKTVNEKPEYQEQVKALRKRFPPRVAPGLFVFTANPATSVGDVLEYISDGKELWGEAADAALTILTSYGLTLEEIQSRARSRDPFGKWIEHLPEKTQKEIHARVGGRFIPLAIREGGLGTNFWLDIQGMDVLVFGSTHGHVLHANPAHLVQMMLRNNPTSALIFLDHVAQGRPRVWHGVDMWAPDFMFAAAAGLGRDDKGDRIARWEDRSKKGRRIAYSAASLEMEPASERDKVARWREQERKFETRGLNVFSALERVAQARGEEAVAEAVEEALAVFKREVRSGEISSQADEVNQYVEHVRTLNGVVKPRDEAIVSAFNSLRAGLGQSREQFGQDELYLAWASRAEIAALGLMFLLNGETPERIDSSLATVDRALDRIRQHVRSSRNIQFKTSSHKPLTKDQAKSLTAHMIQPEMPIKVSDRSKRQVEVSSVKAPETVEKGLAARAALFLEAEREVNESSRSAGYRAVYSELEMSGQDRLPQERWAFASARAIGEMTEVQRAVEEGRRHDAHVHAGRLFALMEIASHAAIDLWTPEGSRQKLHDGVNLVLSNEGRKLDVSNWAIFVKAGGVLPVVFEHAREHPEMRDTAGALMEMAYAALAYEKMLPYMTLEREYVDEPKFWLDAIEFFGKTINDHFDEKIPWAVSTARGTGFRDFFDGQERLLYDKRGEFDVYEFSWKRHERLYRFMRHLFVSKTQLADMPEGRRDDLIGRVGAKGEVHMAVGAGADVDDPAMQQWRAYGQLREICNWGQTSIAMLQDTFKPIANQVGPVTKAMMPYVFKRPVDPKLIGADKAAGLVYLSGVGRPHYQLMVREGAAMDGNIYITQHARFITPDGRTLKAYGPGMASPQELEQAIMVLDDAHTWVPLEIFRTLLIEVDGMKPAEADRTIERMRKAKQIHPKGVRIAARFARPVAVGTAVTIHHHYNEGAMVQAGYPTADKSDALFASTYEKVQYTNAAVLQPNLNYPAQVNWYEDRTEELELTPDIAKNEIRQLLTTFCGTMPFPMIFVKGSRESGSRNLGDFDLSDGTGGIDPEKLEEAVNFTYQVSRGQNVAIARDVSLNNSFHTFLKPEIAESLRARAIRDYNVDVPNEPGKHSVTTIRVTATSPRPGVPYEVAHRLTITSFTGKATNMARQNVAEPLKPEFLRDEIRETFIAALDKQAKLGMEAMAEHTRKLWHDGVTLPDGKYIPPYKEEYKSRYGFYPKEYDARGVPYWHPTWLMIDFLPAADFVDQQNQPADGYRILDIVPGDAKNGKAPIFTLVDGRGNRIIARPTEHTHWLLEWNVGIGQVPEYNRREQYWEYRRAQQEARERGEPGNWFKYVKWENVGVADRQVLQTWGEIEAGEFKSAKEQSGHDWANPKAGPAVAYVEHREAEEGPSGTSAEIALQRARTQLRGQEIAVPSMVSVWVVEYAVQRFQSRLETLRAGLRNEQTYQQTAEQILGEVQTLLAGGLEDLVREFVGAATRVRGVAPGLLENDGQVLRERLGSASQTYRERIANQVLGRVLKDSQTVIPVAVMPEQVTVEGLRYFLSGDANVFAVVTGKELLMDHAVEPFAASARGVDVSILGLHTDWLTDGGLVRRVQYYDADRRVFFEFELKEPVNLSQLISGSAKAFIVDLPEQDQRGTEVDEHVRLTGVLRAGGLEPVNPAGRGQQRADNKNALAVAISNRAEGMQASGMPLPLSVALGIGLELVTVDEDAELKIRTFYERHMAQIKGSSDESPRFVVKPSSGTTGAFRVSVIEPGENQFDELLKAVRGLQGGGYDVLVQRFAGNLTLDGREFVLRSNIAAGMVQSEYTMAAPPGERVVSERRGAAALSGQAIFETLTGPNGEQVFLTPARKMALDAEAVKFVEEVVNKDVEPAGRLMLYGIDRRFYVDENGEVQQFILEVNARPGGMIAAEPQAVNKIFWMNLFGPSVTKPRADAMKQVGERVDQREVLEAARRAAETLLAGSPELYTELTNTEFIQQFIDDMPGAEAQRLFAEAVRQLSGVRFVLGDLGAEHPPAFQLDDWIIVNTAYDWNPVVQAEAAFHEARQMFHEQRVPNLEIAHAVASAEQWVLFPEGYRLQEVERIAGAPDARRQLETLKAKLFTERPDSHHQWFRRYIPEMADRAISQERRFLQMLESTIAERMMEGREEPLFEQDGIERMAAEELQDDASARRQVFGAEDIGQGVAWPRQELPVSEKTSSAAIVLAGSNSGSAGLTSADRGLRQLGIVVTAQDLANVTAGQIRRMLQQASAGSQEALAVPVYVIADGLSMAQRAEISRVQAGVQFVSRDELETQIIPGTNSSYRSLLLMTTAARDVLRVLNARFDRVPPQLLLNLHGDPTEMILEFQQKLDFQQIQDGMRTLRMA